MVGPIRRKKGGGGGSNRIRFPKKRVAKRRGHTIYLLTISGYSAKQKNIYTLFKTRLATIPKTPTALLAVMPRDIKGFQAMCFRLTK